MKKITICMFVLVLAQNAFSQGEVINPTRRVPWWTVGNDLTNDPAVPAVYGTSTIGVLEHFAGTLDAQDFVLGTNTIERMRIKQATGLVGIGTAAPASRLDLAGDIALQEGTAINVVAGNNAIVLTGEYSHYRLTGAAAFAINTITNGNNGQIVTLINATGQIMTVNNNNAANGILTGTGANLVSNTAANNSVTLIYNATLGRWVVTSTSGMASSDDWRLTGNTGTNDPAAPVTYGTSTIAANENWMGTTDANDIVLGTNNIERLRLKQTTGYVGIGTAAPLTKLDVVSINAWDVVNSPGDFTISGTYPFRIGIAQGGAGAGDAYINSRLGTQRIFMGGGTNHQLLTINGSTNMVGIRNTGGLTPGSTLDVAGDLALREGTAMAVAAGNNALTLTGEYSHYRLTGASAFAINTIANGNDGQLVTLINGTGQIMTVNNNNAANGILTGNGANLVSNVAANNSVTLIYNSTLARWIVISSSGMASTDDWRLTGNTGTNDPAVPATYGTTTIAANENWMGTTDANDIVLGTNNIERLRLKQTNGFLGIGTATPAVTADINGSWAYRDGGTLTLVNGNNNDVVLPGNFSEYRITGPTAVFTITGIAGGVNGKVVTLINPTGYTVTLAHNSTSAATNQITVGSGNSYVITGTSSTITLQYNSALSKWIILSSDNGNTELWVRPTGQSYIHDYFTTQARVYDAGQTWAYYYDGTNANGSFFSGVNTGAVMHRNGQPSTDAPSFVGDVWPFVDAGNNGDITIADQITYSGAYAYGGVYNGMTGVGRQDVGFRGIGLDAAGGTNTFWPLGGVSGEVVVGSASVNELGDQYGQQGIFGWHAATAGNSKYGAGVYGRTSQNGWMSGGVIGQYVPTRSYPNEGFYETYWAGYGIMFGALGYANSPAGAMGYHSSLSGIALGVRGFANSQSGNSSWTYAGYFDAYGNQDSRAVRSFQSTGTGINYAGYFTGNHLITGTKTTAFLNQEGKPVLMYCVETPEVLFEDMGSASVANGQSLVRLPEDVMNGVIINSANPIKVFVTPTADLGNYWVEKKDNGFILHAANAANGATFDWRIVAKRKGYEDRRLDYAGADVSFDPYVINPYANPSNNSKVPDWKSDIESKRAAWEEEQKIKHEMLNTQHPGQGDRSPRVDKAKLEKEERERKSAGNR